MTPSVTIRGKAWVEGEASGPLLPLRTPLSFWGGVDPLTGRITDPRHPNHGALLAGQVLAMPGTIGSSSSSAVLLELIRNRVAPAGIVLVRGDAILALGSLVARELGYPPVPILVAPRESWAELLTGTLVRFETDPPSTGQ